MSLSPRTNRLHNEVHKSLWRHMNSLSTNTAHRGVMTTTRLAKMPHNSLQNEQGRWARVKQSSSFIGGTIGPHHNDLTRHYQRLSLATQLWHVYCNNLRVFSSLWRLWKLPGPWRSCSQILVEQGMMWSSISLAFLKGWALLCEMSWLRTIYTQMIVPGKIHSFVRQ